MTSLEHAGDSLLVAYNTQPNLERRDATRVDPGVRGLAVLPLEALQRAPPRLTITLGSRLLAAAETEPVGGVPLSGYTRPRLVALARRPTARLTLYSYTLDDPPGGAVEEHYTPTEAGPAAARRLEVNLSGYTGTIVSLEASGLDRVTLILE